MNLWHLQSIPFLISLREAIARPIIDEIKTQGHKNGIVSSEHETCSKIGVQILKEGGNAVDASIATLLCIGVINNYASGIGGGGFMIVKSGNNNDDRFDGGLMIDFRETAPASAHKDMFGDDPLLSTDGMLATGVPGEIRGFQRAHERYGRLPWSALFVETIKIARNGFLVTPLIEKKIENFKEQMVKDAGLRQTYFHPDGTPKRQGDCIKRENLADTLEIIAEKGPDTFYTGTIAQKIIQFIEKTKEGGFDLADLEGYRVEERALVSGTFMGWTAWCAGPPTSGASLIEILQIVESFLSKKGSPSPIKDKNDINVHVIVEAFKFAYADRMPMGGDPDFMPEIHKLTEKLLDPMHASSVAKMITGFTHDPPYYLDPDGPSVELHSGGTTHVSVIDGDSMSVATTSTVNLEWGCRRMDPVTGIIFNNEMDDFTRPNDDSLSPLTSKNYIEPGKRPFSSATPIILQQDSGDGRIIVAGGAGGTKIITAVAQTLIKMIVDNDGLADATDGCRLHHQLLPNTVIAEHQCPASLLQMLLQRGHSIKVLHSGEFPTSVNVAVRELDGTFSGHSDVRKGGHSAGY